MKGFGFWLITLIVSLGFMFSSCAAPKAPAAPSPAPQQPSAGAPAAPKAAWEEKWGNLVAAAKKEGKLNIYGGLQPDTEVALAKAFKEKFGINVEYFISTASSSARVVKMEAEKAAGVYVADIHLAGWGGWVILKPKGFLHPQLDEFVIHPDALEGKNWFYGSVRYTDRDRTHIVYGTSSDAGLIRNTSLVQAGEITSFAEMADPKWKGKIAMRDPSISGGSSIWYSAVKGQGGLGPDYFRALARNVVITRSSPQVAEWVFQGKYPLGLGASNKDVIGPMALGAPIAFVTAKEGLVLSSGNAGIAIDSKPVHPAAAQLFLNWYLMREAQTIYTTGEGVPSLRLDVTTAHLPPSLVLRKDSPYKYLDVGGEEWVTQRQGDYAEAKTIFLELK